MTWLLDLVAVLVASLSGRSGLWPATARLVLERDGRRCRSCGKPASVVRIVAHHIDPVHHAPEKELDPDNALALCDPILWRTAGCHLNVGHKDGVGRRGWRYWNPNVVKDAAANLAAAEGRP
jgi:5-methylcytosine-specific restriction endonuclease McrA